MFQSLASRAVVSAVCCAVGMVVITGCGSTASNSSGAVAIPATVTATQTVTHAPSSTTAISPTSTPRSSSTSGSTAAAHSATITVPNGVGLNYQAAQDAWRAAGLHVAPAVDALRAGRLPVLDRNWVVLSQDPKASAEVERDSFITATVKKYTDK